MKRLMLLCVLLIIYRVAFSNSLQMKLLKLDSNLFMTKRTKKIRKIKNRDQNQET